MSVGQTPDNRSPSNELTSGYCQRSVESFTAAQYTSIILLHSTHRGVTVVITKDVKCCWIMKTMSRHDRPSIISTYYLNRVTWTSLVPVRAPTLNWFTWDWAVVHIMCGVGVGETLGKLTCSTFPWQTYCGGVARSTCALQTKVIRARPEPHSLRTAVSISQRMERSPISCFKASFILYLLPSLPTFSLIPPFFCLLPPQFNHSSVLLMHFRAPMMPGALKVKHITVYRESRESSRTAV